MWHIWSQMVFLDQSQQHCCLGPLINGQLQLRFQQRHPCAFLDTYLVRVALPDEFYQVQARGSVDRALAGLSWCQTHQGPTYAFKYLINGKSITNFEWAVDEYTLKNVWYNDLSGPNSMALLTAYHRFLGLQPIKSHALQNALISEFCGYCWALVRNEHSVWIPQSKDNLGTSSCMATRPQKAWYPSANQIHRDWVLVIYYITILVNPRWYSMAQDYLYLVLGT